MKSFCGCFTGPGGTVFSKGNNFEEARDNLIDAIELWITITLREGEEVPKIRETQLATSVEHMDQPITTGNTAYAENTSWFENRVNKKAMECWNIGMMGWRPSGKYWKSW